MLIVDDTTFMRMMIKNILERKGLEMVGEAIIAMASGFIVKPFTEAYVMEVLNKLS